MATDQQVEKAFNAGYTMQDKAPELLDKVIATDNQSSEIIEALTRGAKQFQKDKISKQQQAIKDQKQDRTKGR